MNTGYFFLSKYFEEDESQINDLSCLKNQGKMTYCCSALQNIMCFSFKKGNKKGKLYFYHRNK